MANQVMGSVSQSNGGSSKKSGPTPAASRREEQTGQQYWAKGTGFGTGSTTTQWDLEQVRCHVICITFHCNIL